jgi:hypothetical protein
VADGAIEEGDFPPQYNEEFMIIMKMVIYGYQMRDRMAQPEPVPFAKGGLAQAAEALRQQGRGGDTILAHINPEEARLLKRMGGSGTINPNTGLPEFLKFKGITNFVSGAAKAVGGAVKSVVGAVSKVLGPELTMVALTVGGFMLGGPALAPYMGSLAGFAGAAGAALGSAVGTYGQGGSFKDVLLNSATAFAGAQFAPTYGWKAGAAIGGASTLARGGSFKDALKNAAIGAGTTALMQGLSPAAEGTPPDVPTPDTISGANPSGASNTPVLTPNTVSPFELNAGPPPVAAPAPNYNLSGPVSTAPSASGLGSLNYQPPTNYLAGAPSAGTAGISSLGGATAGTAPMTLGQVGSNIMQGNFGQAGSDALTWMGQNKLITAGAALGLTGAMGGFTPEQPPPPNLLEKDASGRPITGEDLIAQDPTKYVVQGMPGVRYDASGNIDRTGTGTPYQPNPAFQPSQTFASPTYGTANQPTYPTYTPPMAAAAPVAGNPVAQPYNTLAMYNFLPSNQPRYMNEGGIASMFPPGSGVLQMNRGGYPRKTGQISGPGTETSDDIPAMLSDGEFVVTAKAVRGIGNGSRREGAKKLYRMMHAMEKKAGGKV